MSIYQATAPSFNVVTLAQAKEQCSVLDSTFDTLLDRLVAAATTSVEQYLSFGLATRTWNLRLDEFPSRHLDLKTAHVTAVSGVAYSDPDNVEQTLTVDTDYLEDFVGRYPCLTPVDAWPATYDRTSAVRITLTAGYASADAVPDDIKHAILMRVAEMFDKREESYPLTAMTTTSVATEMLLAPYRRIPV